MLTSSFVLASFAVGFAAAVLRIELAVVGIEGVVPASSAALQMIEEPACKTTRM